MEISSSVAPSMATAPISSLWQRTITRTNKVFLILILIPLCTIDASLAFSSSDLMPFFLMMIAATAIFLGFFFLEKFVLKPRFESTTSKLDSGIYALVMVRNIILLLNVIPFIQVLGGMAAIFISIPYLLIYFILIGLRSGSAQQSQTLS